jgi:hypothetical protein
MAPAPTTYTSSILLMMPNKDCHPLGFHDTRPGPIPTVSSVSKGHCSIERIRGSCRGKAKPGVLTGADQVVLAAVKITFKHLARAS